MSDQDEAAKWAQIDAALIDAWLLAKRRADPRAVAGFLASACDLLPEEHGDPNAIARAFMLLAGAIARYDAKQEAARAARRKAALQPAGAS